MPTTDTSLATTSLRDVRGLREARDAADVALLVGVLDWVETQPAGVGDFDEHCLVYAGDGVPPVSEYAATDLAPVLEVSTHAAGSYLTSALELRHRLPRLFQRVLNGEVAAWRARRITERTTTLSATAAAFVDRQVAGHAHSLSGAQLDRTVAEAITRHDPAEAERRAQDAADGRRFDVHLDTANASGVDGMVEVTGRLAVRTRSTSTRRSATARNDWPTSGRPTPWTHDAPSRPATWPAPNSPSTSRPARRRPSAGP